MCISWVFSVCDWLSQRQPAHPLETFPDVYSQQMMGWDEMVLGGLRLQLFFLLFPVSVWALSLFLVLCVGVEVLNQTRRDGGGGGGGGGQMCRWQSVKGATPSRQPATCWTLTARARQQNQAEAFYPAMVCQNSGPVYNLMLFSRFRSMWTELNPHSCFASRIFSDFMGTSSDENLVMLHRNSNHVMVFV